MNPPQTEVFDKRLKKCLTACAKSKLTPSQRNAAAAQLKKLALETEALGLSNLVEEIGTFFLSRERLKELHQTEVFPTEQFLELGRRGMAATLQFGIANSPECFAELPVEVLLQEVSSSVLLNQIAQKRQKLLVESLGFLQKQPERAVHLAGLPWILAKAKIEHLFPLLPAIFTCDNRSIDTDRRSTLRIEFLRRDKAGKGIVELLARISRGEVPVAALTDGLRRCPAAAIVFLKILPKLLPIGDSGHVLVVLEDWLSAFTEIPFPKRAMISGALAILGGGILQKPRPSPAEEKVFALVTSTVKQVSLEIGGDVTGFWGLLPLGESRLQAAKLPPISPEQARLLIESLEKLEDEQYDPISVFTALAINFGLFQFEEPGAEVSFDPKKHDDAVGGLLRDQPAVVVRAGWSHKDTILLKSKTKPRSNNV